ncbi:hypothetical protein L1887_59044 [Cichorium endivia]|nr:hypothetical protein L1887_59044 [Cichorium endivia]
MVGVQDEAELAAVRPNACLLAWARADASSEKVACNASFRVSPRSDLALALQSDSTQRKCMPDLQSQLLAGVHPRAYRVDPDCQPFSRRHPHSTSDLLEIPLPSACPAQSVTFNNRMPPPQKSQHRFCSTNQARQLERVSKRKILDSPSASWLGATSGCSTEKLFHRRCPLSPLLCSFRRNARATSSAERARGACRVVISKTLVISNTAPSDGFPGGAMTKRISLRRMDSAAGQGVRTRLVVPRYHFIKAATEIYIPAHPTLPLLRVGIPSSSTLFFGFLTTMTTTRALARVEHMTCAWFTSCMSLGGISNLLLSRIIDSDPLHRIGIALLILNMFYFVALLLLQVVRFTFTPARVGYTLSHPIECLFVPTIVLAAATILNGLAGGRGKGGWEWSEDGVPGGVLGVLCCRPRGECGLLHQRMGEGGGEYASHEPGLGAPSVSTHAVWKRSGSGGADADRTECTQYCHLWANVSGAGIYSIVHDVCGVVVAAHDARLPTGTCSTGAVHVLWSTSLHNHLPAGASTGDAAHPTRPSTAKPASIDVRDALHQCARCKHPALGRRGVVLPDHACRHRRSSANREEEHAVHSSLVGGGVSNHRIRYRHQRHRRRTRQLTDQNPRTDHGGRARSRVCRRCRGAHPCCSDRSHHGRRQG